MAGAADLWKRIQSRMGLVADGVPGATTAAAVERAIWGEAKAVATPEAVKSGEFSARTERVLGSLVPGVQAAFRSLMVLARAIAARHGLTVEAISGLRTFAAQDDLYAQGRTRPGKVVTKARGGYSNHNFGIAIDMGLFRGRGYVDGDEPALAERVYREVAQEAEKLGIAWGGNWKSIKDTPHFELKTGLTLAQMRARAAKGESVV